MTNKGNGALYTGVTASLELRVFQHRERTGSGFTERYGCTRLVWYERYERMDEAIAREKHDQSRQPNEKARPDRVDEPGLDGLVQLARPVMRRCAKRRRKSRGPR
jgi:predicted GIY-YIG superfamily endonuclease